MQGATGGSPVGMQPHVNRRSSYGSIYIDPAQDAYKPVYNADYGPADGYSDQDTIKGGSVQQQNQEDLPKASNKVQSLIHDVLATEQRCDFLSQRNEWLTGKLLQSQKGFVERMMTGNSSQKKRIYFSEWSKMMGELRLEKQLFEMSKSLEKLQKMGKDCSNALEKETAMKEQAEAALAKADKEVHRVTAENANLRRQIEADTRRMALLERRLTEAETTIFRSRKDAQGVLEAVTNYDHTREMLDKEAKEGGPREPTSLEQSVMLRQEVSTTIDRMQGTLERFPGRQSLSRDVSPTRMASQPTTMGSARQRQVIRGNVSPQPRTQYMGSSVTMGNQFMMGGGPVRQTTSFTPTSPVQYGGSQVFAAPGYGMGQPMPTYGQASNGMPMYSPQPGQFMGGATPLSSRAPSPAPMM